MKEINTAENSLKFKIYKKNMFKNKIQFFFKKLPWFEILPRLTLYFINKKCTSFEMALFFWGFYIDINPPYNKDDFKNLDCFDQDIEYP